MLTQENQEAQPQVCQLSKWEGRPRLKTTHSKAATQPATASGQSATTFRENAKNWAPLHCRQLFRWRLCCLARVPTLLQQKTKQKQ